ncbi:3-methyladenine DNA glycosylase AlkC [Sphingopyxis sp. YR583]|uniref:DNA alkylation repair protein n=1 Tax=Sphingopyxis sp. YR583 TaxID=1881047 RepID=UPI0008A76A08|nr:DNA alkylation repair protein [Sphingopyxis sp. YR583]SEH10679.1 3-methyladenine DNA glycosylase AlkC [Sphingopyxis sp. YR583]
MMAEEAASPALLKDILGTSALETIADAGATASARFDRPTLLRSAADGLDALSIMERVRHIAGALHTALRWSYPEALDVIRAMAPHLTHAFQAMAVTEYVARYGLDDFDRSMDVLAELTRFGSAEFAIRPFLAADTPRALVTMMRWTDSEDEHVRRLASEGARPRLPWAARVPALKADPTLASPILEALRTDASLYVRKSVANHLNDIAKDRPDWLLDRLAGWSQDNPRTGWIVRHALRTLIKQGEPRALALIGVGHGAAATVLRFAIVPETVCLGDSISIAAELVSDSRDDQRLVVDYRIHYARAAGKTAPKVFKFKTFELAANETVTMMIAQTIRDFSTRRHYPGRHRVELIVNGQTMAEAAFDLVPG